MMKNALDWVDLLSDFSRFFLYLLAESEDLQSGEKQKKDTSSSQLFASSKSQQKWRS